MAEFLNDPRTQAVALHAAAFIYGLGIGLFLGWRFGWRFPRPSKPTGCT